MTQKVGDPDIQELRSDGIAFLNSDPREGVGDGATIIVVGVSRSGTSMVAACLRAFGVFMGDQKLASPVHEDVEIATAVEADNQARLRELISRRDGEHSTWGFKRPMAFKLISRYLHLFRNPRFVITFRDPVAIARRNEISMQMPFIGALRLARDQTAELIDFVERLHCPAMLVSYEKALLGPTDFASQLADFCGIATNATLTEKAAAVIESGPELYLTSSRLKLEGRLDVVAGGVAQGWARQIGQKQPRTVVIKCEGRTIGRGRADLFRPDLEKAGKEGGKCAFRIVLDESVAIGKEVIAEVDGTVFTFRSTGPATENRVPTGGKSAS